MLYIEDKVMKLGGVYLAGQVTKIEIQESASIDEIEDDKGNKKTNQPTGYDTSKINIDIILEDTKKKSTWKQLQDLQRLFRTTGQTKAKAFHVVNADCAARGISKVYFKNLTSSHVISESKRLVSLELWSTESVQIKAKKKNTLTSSKSSKESSKSKTSKQESKSPALDNRSTSTGKKAAKRIIKSR